MTLNISFPGIAGLYLAISFSNNVIIGIEFLSFNTGKNNGVDPERNSVLSEYGLNSEQAVFAKKINKEFSNYFLTPGHHFSLPCRLEQGTLYQQKVWRALLQIPAGQIKTYGKLAMELNSSPRAVGNACRKNPLPVIVPCHRIVSATGIGGYAGDTAMTQKGAINYLQIKQSLLAHEKASIK